MHGPSTSGSMPETLPETLPEAFPETWEESARVEGERYDRSQDNAARLIVFFGPYVLWGSLGALVGILFLLSD